ncbi:ABC transporter substrate-binding protein [Allostella sp. ATCC 35155]|nr:ABC transporter substrate-binding protein [Stella sp. ATCC 35155]
MKTRIAFVAATALAMALAVPVAAKTFKYSTTGDVIGMDPHINNEGPTNAMKDNLYEGLVSRHWDLTVRPALATEWTQVNPTTTRFKLRAGVTFHDGTPFTADDVVFSFDRIRGDQSDMKTYVTGVREVRKIDDLTVELVTEAPDPVLIQNLSLFHIMSKAWAQKHNTLLPLRGANAESFANRNANGTGPFKMVERVPDTRTVLVPNEKWWGKPEHNLTRVEFKPIANAATRVAALLTGEIDMMFPVPLQDVPRLERTAGVKVLQGPELRTIFLGMDQFRDELLDMPGTGKNPFKDVRVRRAFYQAIDINAIQRVVMRGASTPTGLMIAPGINGFSKELNQRYPFDPEASKKLLAEAGYPQGFPVTLDCPNDRYVNDEAICQAIVPMLTRVGINIKLNAQTKGLHFDKIGLKDGRRTSFYMLGWTPGTYDAHNMLFNIITLSSGPGSGAWNSGRYTNPKVEELTRSIAREIDPEKRTAMIHEAMKLHKEDFGHIPLHQQALAWGVRDSVAGIPQAANDAVMLKYVRMK